MSHLPLPDAYQRALLNPGLCFSDPELKNGTVQLNRRGLPMTWSGQFATVFRLQTAAGPQAVRCFTARLSDQQERYAHLHRHIAHQSLPMLAAFDYQPNGLRVNGAWYPIVKMEWVNGLKLDEYVEEMIQKKDARRLDDLARQWAALIVGLRRQRLAHGDLQHENILVSHGAIRLVDYDGVFVPGLTGRAALEIGHVHYQHPRRAPADFNLEIDNFSALVIYLSLKALAAEPGLWPKFHQDKHLILRADDFKTPSTSAVLTALKHSRAAEVQALAAALCAACAAPLMAVPTLESLIAPGASVPTLTLPIAPANAPATASVHPSANPSPLPPPPSTPQRPARLWYLRNLQAWVVFGMGAVTALLVNEIWIVTLGVIGYLLVLLFESATRHVAPAALEMQNRELTQEVQALKAEIKKFQKKP